MPSVTTVPTSATGPSPSDRAGDLRRWHAAAVAVAVFAAAYVLVPVETVVRDSAGVVVELAAVALIVDGVRRYRPRAAAAWLLIAGGMLAWAMGDAVWVAYTLADEDPFPSAADVFYLGGYPLVVAGLFVGIRWRTPRTDVRVLIDAAIVTVTAATIGWVYVVETWNAESSRFDALVASAYPIADVLLCAIAVRLALGGSWRDVRALQLLLLAVAMTFSGDLLFALGELRGIEGERIADALLVIAIPVLGLAGSHPSMVALTEEAPSQPAEPSVSRMTFLSGVALVPAVFIVVQAVRGETAHLAVAAAATLLLAGLMIVRFADLAAGARRAAGREAILSRYASELLASTGHDALSAHAERTARMLADGRTARVVGPGEAEEDGYAFRASIPVRGEITARPRRRCRAARAASSPRSPRHRRRRALAGARARGACSPPSARPHEALARTERAAAGARPSEGLSSSAP